MTPYPLQLPPHPIPKNRVPPHGGKDICGLCGRTFSTIGFTTHKRTCTGPPVKVNRQHVLCSCGRKKSKLADTCFRCSNPGEDFARLDKALAGVEKGKGGKRPAAI